MMDNSQYLNPCVKQCNKKSPTLEINERSIALQKQGKTIYRFGLGQSPFPVPQSVVQALCQNAKEKDYLPTSGLKGLRYAAANWLQRKGLNFQEDDIMIGPGSKELLFLAGLALDSELIANTPCWVSYIPQAIFLGKKIIYIHNSYENKWRLDPCELDKVLTENKNDKAKVIILTYPDNPTGLSYTGKELKLIAQVARKHNIIVISDQIYGDIHFDQAHESIAQFYPENTIISTGLSKSLGAGGWRLGLFAFPKSLNWMRNTMINIASETFSAVTAPVQYASITAFQQKQDIQEYLGNVRAIMRYLGLWTYKLIVKNTQVKTHEPQGGFYIFLDLQSYREKLAAQNIHDSLAMCEKLLQETGVATLPGSAFGRNTSQMTLRLSYVNFNGGDAIQGLRNAKKELIEDILNENFLNKYCQNTVKGLEAFIGWVNKL